MYIMVIKSRFCNNSFSREFDDNRLNLARRCNVLQELFPKSFEILQDKLFARILQDELFLQESYKTYFFFQESYKIKFFFQESYAI